ncbi:hypothetical protein AAVH_33175 [Aphelenchoides avenae]|nr:hypothetical protein AAVH_33175 [Aphelenchus avenae]
MLTDEVSSGQVKRDGPLEHLTKCWKSRVYDAAVFTKKILGTLWGDVEDMDDRDRAYYGIAMCVFVEPHVLYNFAQSSGIFDALTSEACRTAFVQRCMMTWGFYIMVVNTVRCKGHLATPNRISCSTWDGAILPNDREWAREFYTQLRVRTVDVAVEYDSL